MWNETRLRVCAVLCASTDELKTQRHTNRLLFVYTIFIRIRKAIPRTSRRNRRHHAIEQRITITNTQWDNGIRLCNTFKLKNKKNIFALKRRKQTTYPIPFIVTVCVAIIVCLTVSVSVCRCVSVWGTNCCALSTLDYCLRCGGIRIQMLLSIKFTPNRVREQ